MPIQSKIGRGHPPKHTQFQKGVSGNIKGRRKGSKNFSTILREAAQDTVVATIGGKQRKITKLRASAMQLATKAAAGDHKAIGKFLDLCDEMEKRAAAAKPREFPFSAQDLEILREVHGRMQKCAPPPEDD
jgi:Family of unknown function (DUF5681)